MTWRHDSNSDPATGSCDQPSGSDEQLALAAQTGCLASFERLVMRYQVPLVHFLLRRTRSREDAEDIAQEAFVRAYQNLHRYRSRWRFRTWLMTIAYRLCLNEMRRRSIRRRNLILHDPHEPLVSLAWPGQGPVEVAAAREESQRLWDVVASVVGEPKLTALWLYYVEELTTEEIGRVLGCSRGAIKTMLCRARKTLLPALARFEREDGAVGATAGVRDGAWMTAAMATPPVDPLGDD